MALPQLQNLKEETQTSSGGALLIDFMKQWSQPYYSVGTVGAQHWRELQRAFDDTLSDIRFLESNDLTTEGYTPAYTTFDHHQLESNDYQIAHVGPEAQDDLLIDEPIPDKPIYTFQVNAVIADVNFILTSRPLDDDPENDLIDE